MGTGFPQVTFIRTEARHPSPPQQGTPSGVLAHAVAFGVTCRHEDAEDAARESLVLALERIADCRNPAKFGGWLLSIVRLDDLDPGLEDPGYWMRTHARIMQALLPRPWRPRPHPLPTNGSLIASN